MMKSNRIALLVFATFLLGSTLPLGAAAPPKFRPSGSGDSGTGRYVITLTADAGEEDITAMKRELPLLYGAALEGSTSSDVRQFTVTMTPARARLLSTDPRVTEVAEAPSASTPAAPTPTPVSSARHFTTQASGYGDNGQSGTYTYDSSGNITAIGTDTYLYDLEERLSVSVTRGVTETYVYDAFGNRQSAMGAVNCLGQTTCAQPVTLDEHTNRLQTINSAAVQYDTAGNVTTIAGTPSTTYTYDGTGMMVEQTVGSDDRQFVYTADDERIAVRQGASWTWTVRDPSDKVLREFTSMETGGSGFAMTNRQWLKDYVWRDGLLLATTTSSGTLHYHLDHLGTPRLVTDGRGAKVAEHAYYPFGAEIALTPHETPEEAMKFTGHERDIVAGDGHTLDYMHARYYNASWGRFLEVDPIEPDAGKPQSWNRYAYASNNPMAMVDLLGLEGVYVFNLFPKGQFSPQFDQEIGKQLSAAGVSYYHQGDLDMSQMTELSMDETNDILVIGHSAENDPTSAFDFHLGGFKDLISSGLAANVAAKSFSVLSCVSSTMACGMPPALGRTPGVYLGSAVDSNVLLIFGKELALGLQKKQSLKRAAKHAKAVTNGVNWISGVKKIGKVIIRPKQKDGDPFAGTGFVSADNVRH